MGRESSWNRNRAAAGLRLGRDLASDAVPAPSHVNDPASRIEIGPSQGLELAAAPAPSAPIAAARAGCCSPRATAAAAA